MTFAYGVHSPVRTIASLDRVSFLNSSCGTSVTTGSISWARNTSIISRVDLAGNDNLLNHHLAQQHVERLDKGRVPPLDGKVDALHAPGDRESGVAQSDGSRMPYPADLMAQFAVQQSCAFHGSL